MIKIPKSLTLYKKNLNNKKHCMYLVLFCRDWGAINLIKYGLKIQPVKKLWIWLEKNVFLQLIRQNWYWCKIFIRKKRLLYKYIGADLHHEYKVTIKKNQFSLNVIKSDFNNFAGFFIFYILL
jgi:hypothetical protein